MEHEPDFSPLHTICILTGWDDFEVFYQDLRYDRKLVLLIRIFDSGIPLFITGFGIGT